MSGTLLVEDVDGVDEATLGSFAMPMYTTLALRNSRVEKRIELSEMCCENRDTAGEREVFGIDGVWFGG
ncbi:MAG: hypothetical protein F4Y02_00980 [Chloroflexi bacterium]|nr:hypothetical protein [Chloroflexota bacterium]